MTIKDHTMAPFLLTTPKTADNGLLSEPSEQSSQSSQFMKLALCLKVTFILSSFPSIGYFYICIYSLRPIFASVCLYLQYEYSLLTVVSISFNLVLWHFVFFYVLPKHLQRCCVQLKLRESCKTKKIEN